VSRWPLNCNVLPGLPLSSRTATAGAEGMVCRRPLDLEAFAGQHLSQPVEDCAGVPGLAGNLNQLDDSANETFAVNEQAEALREVEGEGAWDDFGIWDFEFRI